jgi:hypothetical protein
MNNQNKYVYMSNKFYKLLEQNICTYQINYMNFQNKYVYMTNKFYKLSKKYLYVQIKLYELLEQICIRVKQILQIAETINLHVPNFFLSVHANFFFVSLWRRSLRGSSHGRILAVERTGIGVGPDCRMQIKQRKIGPGTCAATESKQATSYFWPGQPGPGSPARSCRA